MNKFLQNITSLVAIVLFLIMGACNNHPQAPILLEVEKIIEEQPDSALSILNKVENINQLSEKDHATYCLLLTQAQDLNYITHTSDSLIKIAATYFEKSNDKHIYGAGGADRCGGHLPQPKGGQTWENQNRSTFVMS